MQYFLTSAALVAAATMALAAPAADAVPKGAFTVNQVEAGKKFLSGPLALMNAYNKYNKVGAVAPDHIRTAAAAAAQSGSVTANPSDQYDSSYLSPVSAGGQTLNLDFDTGSADLWVFSTLQPSSQTAGHTLYNPSKSTTAKRLSGYTWNIGYGDGSGASGVVYLDKVVIGGVTATSQAVEAATSVSSQFTQDTGTNGLVGLAFSSINTVSPNQQTTFFDTVKNTLASKLFTVTLKKGAPGSYDFGYINTSKYKGSIAYTPVDNSQGFWGFTAGTYSVGSGAFSSSSIGSAIADTGTTLLLIPSAAAQAYYAKVSGASYSNSQGGYIFPCSASLPSFNVKIGSGTFTVPGSYINYAPVSSTSCYGGIQPNTGIGLTIFGDIFLKAQYVVFDQTQSSPRLGFAAQA